jgi:hypothetical protein
MLIVNFGHFQVVNRDKRILYYENEDGLDWYELRTVLTNWERETGDFVDAVYGAFATVDPAGIIIHVEYNPSRIIPDDKVVIGIDADWKKIEPGVRYKDGKILPSTIASRAIVGRFEDADQ